MRSVKMDIGYEDDIVVVIAPGHSHACNLTKHLVDGCPGNKQKMNREEFIKFVTWMDIGSQYYPSFWGRRNLKYKGHPNFRPNFTLIEAPHPTEAPRNPR